MGRRLGPSAPVNIKCGTQLAATSSPGCHAWAAACACRHRDGPPPAQTGRDGPRWPGAELGTRLPERAGHPPPEALVPATAEHVPVCACACACACVSLQHGPAVSGMTTKWVPRGGRRHLGHPECFLPRFADPGAGGLVRGEGLGVGTQRGSRGVSQGWRAASGRGRLLTGAQRGGGEGGRAAEPQLSPKGRGPEARRHLSPVVVDAEPASAGSAWSPKTCWVSSDKRGRRRAARTGSSRGEAGGRSRVGVCGEQPPRGGGRGAWGEAGLPQQTRAGSLRHAWLQQLCWAPRSKLLWKSGTRSVCFVWDEARLCAGTPGAPPGRAHCTRRPRPRHPLLRLAARTSTRRPRPRQTPRTPAWRGPRMSGAAGAAGRSENLGTALRALRSRQHCRHPVPLSCGATGVSVVLWCEVHPRPAGLRELDLSKAVSMQPMGACTLGAPVTRGHPARGRTQPLAPEGTWWSSQAWRGAFE